MTSKKNIILVLAGICVLAGVTFFLQKDGIRGDETKRAEVISKIENDTPARAVMDASVKAGVPSPSKGPIGGSKDVQTPKTSDSVSLAGKKPIDLKDVPLATAEPTGERTVAKIVNEGKEQTLTPNEIGHFPRVYIKALQELPVELSFPDGQQDDPVVLQVEHGGGIDGEKAAKVDTLDAEKKLAFKFKANQDEGVYHVVIRKGADMRVLDFWVGAEPPVAVR